MLSKAQRNVLSGILAYRRLTGVSPSIRELATLTERSNEYTLFRLRELTALGLIADRPIAKKGRGKTQDKSSARSIVPRTDLTFDSVGNVYETVRTYD